MDEHVFPGAVLAADHDGTIAGGAVIDAGIVGPCPEHPNSHLHRLLEPEPTPDGGWTTDEHVECCFAARTFGVTEHQEELSE